VAGLALVGLPPSGGYPVKSLYASAATDLGAWRWRPALESGGLLSAAYLARILAVAVSPRSACGVAATGGVAVSAPLRGLLVPLLLAFCALLLGLAPPALFSLMDVGRADMASAAAVADVMRTALSASSVWSSAGPLLAVALLVVLFHAVGESAWQRRLDGIGQGLSRFEGWLRQWPTAGALLLSILLIQGWTATR
jgi:multicomponent Na+:H+ antiporter subunit D